MSLEIAGHLVHPLFPFLVAYAVALVMSTAGLSGAFLLLPFQVSVLGFAGPAVTPTNHLFNVVAIPSGVYRYVREGRMVWPLTAVIVAGTVPGVVLGSLGRIYVLADPRAFKLFVGCVLLFLGVRLILTILRPRPPAKAPVGELHVRTVRFDARRLEYEYQGQIYGCATFKLSLLTVAVGVVGGAYGVGGGAIIAPFLVSFAGLPVHTIAGATLLGTCLTSFVAVAFFALLGPALGQPHLAPHWALGLTLGAGGLLGTYTGARLQRRLPARAIETVLAVATTSVALSYIVKFFLR